MLLTITLSACAIPYKNSCEEIVTGLFLIDDENGVNQKQKQRNSSKSTTKRSLSKRSLKKPSSALISKRTTQPTV